MKDNNNTSLEEILQQTFLFANMDEHELKEIAKIAILGEYKKDALLFMQGEVSEYLYILTKGIVRVYKHDSKGNEIIIAYFRPYSLIAEAATLKGVPFPSTAIFKTDGYAIKIKMDAFKRDFMTNPKISNEIINSLLGKIQLLQQNINFNLGSSAKEKILEFYKKNPDLGAELKRYEIASLLSITPETLSRNIKALIKEEKLTKSSIS